MATPSRSSVPTRIAVLADTHLSDLPGTAQDAALDWALAWLRAAPPDLVLVAGDVTTAGTTSAARRARAKLDASGLTFRMAPGNSDCRSPQHCTGPNRWHDLPGPSSTQEVPVWRQA